MIVDLSTDDLVNLVAGISPPHSLMDKLQSRGLGSYTGGFHDKWDWNRYRLSELFEYELFEIYGECKEAIKPDAKIDIQHRKTNDGISWHRKKI